MTASVVVCIEALFCSPGAKQVLGQHVSDGLVPPWPHLHALAYTRQVHVFKKTARKRYRKYRAARPQLTTLRVLEVRDGVASVGVGGDRALFIAAGTVY